MFGFIVMCLLGFGGGGIVGKVFFDGYYPAAWIGLAVGAALWVLAKVGALDEVGDVFDYGD